ncbi:MAG: CapA family protein [Cyclobacteriaceae bacterium]|nr:CapA family protein [Cyclobacteriaceae bacterium]
MKKLLIIFFFYSISGAGQDTTRLSLLFLGDIMQHDSQIAAAYDPTTQRYDYGSCFQFVKPYIQSADIAIGNLEVTLAGPPYKGYPQFSAPDELVHSLKSIGMDVLVTANNHCVDRGKKGLERTIEMLDSINLPHTGTFADEASRLNDYPLFIQKNGFKLALLNFTYGTNGLPVYKPNVVNMIDTAQIRQDLVQAKKHKPDAIIIFAHWGAEYQNLPMKIQVDLTSFFFKHGAQLVIGAHPHVIQPMEWRKDKNQLVAYSLGNFVSGQRKRYTDGGAMIRVELEKIAFKPDSIVTSIDTAGFILQWVYRTVDAKKKYYVLPIPDFESDTTNFIKDAASVLAMKTFITDSRELLSRHNLSITEWSAKPVDANVSYSVQLTDFDSPIRDSIHSSLTFYEWNEERDASGRQVVFSGEFKSKKQADQHCEKLKALGAHQAVVVKYVEGVMQNE